MDALQGRIGYRFGDAALLARALTHPSLAGQGNNQRLEFLGDAVIGLIVANILHELFPHEQEGELARRRAGLVRGETLTQIARDIALGDALKLAASEKRDNPSNLEDALEALLGAIYLDGGLSAAEAFIGPRMRALALTNLTPPKDAKTALQEWSQARGLPVTHYALIATTGPAHAPEFTVEATVQGFAPQRAQAASKRLAEQQAAATLLERVQHDS